jgi:hypothetical protein
VEKEALSSQLNCVFKDEPASQRVKSKMAAYSPPRKTGKRAGNEACEAHFFIPPTISSQSSQTDGGNYDKGKNIKL